MQYDVSTAPVDEEVTASLPTIKRRRAAPVRQRHVLLGLMIALLVVSTIIEVGWWNLTAMTTNLPGTYFNQGQNAIWIAHTWVGDAHTRADYAALAARFQREQIKYVFAHVGPLDDTGAIAPARYPYAGQFIAAIHAYDPTLHVYAWMGQIYRFGALPGDGVIDLARPETRQRIVDTATIFTHQLGFDGVHYDIEPVPNNDNHFLDLLDETRHSIGSDRAISVATPNWIPIARLADAMEELTGRANVWWTTYYYNTISQHADQVVVMLYNTGMPTAPLYETLVEQETAHILRAVQRGSAQTHVLIGIPTYTASTSRAFHAAAENIRTGLHGVISGLNFNTFHSAFTGIAIYPEWLTTDSDWAIYNQLWLGEQ